MDLNYFKIHFIAIYITLGIFYTASWTEKSKHSISPLSLEQFSYKIVLNSYFSTSVCALAPPFPKGSTAKRQCENRHLLTDTVFLSFPSGKDKRKTEIWVCPKMENVNLMFTLPNLQGTLFFSLVIVDKTPHHSVCMSLSVRVQKVLFQLWLKFQWNPNRSSH